MKIVRCQRFWKALIMTRQDFLAVSYVRTPWGVRSKGEVRRVFRSQSCLREVGGDTSKNGPYDLALAVDLGHSEASSGQRLVGTIEAGAIPEYWAILSSKESPQPKLMNVHCELREGVATIAGHG